VDRPGSTLAQVSPETPAAIPFRDETPYFRFERARRAVSVVRECTGMCALQMPRNILQSVVFFRGKSAKIRAL